MGPEARLISTLSYSSFFYLPIISERILAFNVIFSSLFVFGVRFRNTPVQYSLMSGQTLIWVVRIRRKREVLTCYLFRV